MKHQTNLRRASIALALGGLLALGALETAHADRGHTDAGVSARGAHGERDSVATTPLDDSQSIHLLTTVNTGEIDLARLALERSGNQEVRRFAQEMIRGHGDAQSRIDAWSSEHHTAPAASPVSEEVERDAGDVRQRIERAEDFDRAYVASQVAMHGDALRLIDERILPGVRDSSLRSLVQAIRNDVVHHLEMAQALERRVD